MTAQWGAGIDKGMARVWALYTGSFLLFHLFVNTIYSYTGIRTRRTPFATSPSTTRTHPDMGVFSLRRPFVHTPSAPDMGTFRVFMFVLIITPQTQEFEHDGQTNSSPGGFSVRVTVPACHPQPQRTQHVERQEREGNG